MIAYKLFGRLTDGRDVSLFTLRNENGDEVDIIEYGARIVSWRVNTGRERLDVVTGYDTLSEYENDGFYFGAVVGRYANRIGGGRLVINGKEHKLETGADGNCLHGGLKGFDKRLFSAKPLSADTLLLTYVSADGEEGFCGELTVCVKYTLTAQNSLVMEVEAESDADTVCNIANHAYFNLDGHEYGSIGNHTIKIDSQYVTETDDNLIATGRLIDVEGSALDLREGRRLDAFDTDCAPIASVGGYDFNYCFDATGELKLVAEVWSDASGLALSVLSTLPGVQFYSGNFLDGTKGKGGAEYCKNSALCLEAQFYPESPNIDSFPSPLLKKGEKYRHVTEYAIKQTKNQ